MKKALLFLIAILALFVGKAQTTFAPYQPQALYGAFTPSGTSSLEERYGPKTTLFEHQGNMYLQVYRTLYKFNNNTNRWDVFTTNFASQVAKLDYRPKCMGSTGNIAFVAGDSEFQYGTDSGIVYYSSDLLNWKRSPNFSIKSINHWNVRQSGLYYSFENLITSSMNIWFTKTGTSFAQIPLDSLFFTQGGTNHYLVAELNGAASKKSLLFFAHNPNLVYRCDSTDSLKRYPIPRRIPYSNTYYMEKDSVFSDDDNMVFKVGNDSILVFNFNSQICVLKKVSLSGNSIGNLELKYFNGTRLIAFASVGSNYSQITSTDLGNTWSKQFDFNLNSLPISPLSFRGNVVYGAGQLWSINESGNKFQGGIARSTDNGATWQAANEGVNSFPSLMVGNNFVLALNKRGQLCKTTDMQNWQTLSPDSTSYIVAYNVSGNYIYQVRRTFSGQSFISSSTDAGNTFHESRFDKLLANSNGNYGYELAANGKNAFVSCQPYSGIRYTINGGTTWDSLYFRGYPPPFFGFTFEVHDLPYGLSDVYTLDSLFVTYGGTFGLEVSADGTNWQPKIIPNARSGGYYYSDGKYLYDFCGSDSAYSTKSYKIDLAAGTASIIDTAGINPYRITAVQGIGNYLFVADDNGLKVSNLGQRFTLVPGIPEGSFVYKLFLFNNYLYAVTNNGMFATAQPVAVQRSIRMEPFVSAYPNPFLSEINLGNSEEWSSASLTDVTGKTIWAENNVPAQTAINLPNLKAGIYILKASDSKGNPMPTQKLVKQ